MLIRSCLEALLSDEKHGDIRSILLNVEPLIISEFLNKAFSRLLKKEDIRGVFGQGTLDFLNFFGFIKVGTIKVLLSQGNVRGGLKFSSFYLFELFDVVYEL